MNVGQKVRVFGLNKEWVIGEIKELDKEFAIVYVDKWLGVKPGEYRVLYSSLEIILSAFR